MKLTLLWKGLTLGGLFIILMIALANIQGAINERSYFRDSAMASVAKSWTNNQRVSLPVLVIPYEVMRQEKLWNKQKQQYVIEQHFDKKFAYYPMEKAALSAQLQTSVLKRGIFSVPVYDAKITIAAKVLHEYINALKNKEGIKLSEPPYIAISVSDQRGISELPKVNSGEQSLVVSPGSGLLTESNGFKFNLKPASETQEFSINFSLKGMSQFSVVPTAKDTQVSIESNWQHPSFTGAFLPIKRDISESGYTAHWSTNNFSSSVEESLLACQNGHCAQLFDAHFGVKQIDPVDHYLKSERSTKYGSLVILLVFVCFVLFEVMNRLRFHPIQYLLVGFAVTLFYLLLIALSEHLSFGVSYFIAAAACVALVSVYMSYVLNTTLSAGLSLGLLATYGILYMIILSEDYAFISGAILLFACLSLVMLVTRKINWYELQQNQKARFAQDTNP